MRRACVTLVWLVLFAVAVAVAAGAGSAVAWAGSVASWSERQTIPGLTERTIWGKNQVFVYRLPQNVTHTGNVHVELTFTPADRDCFAYLLGPVAKGSTDWQVCPATYSQGFLDNWPGRVVVDYDVPAVLDDRLTDEGLVGDTYYVVVQAANAMSRFRLSGYTPRAIAGSIDSVSEATFSRVAWRTPSNRRAWKTLTGAPYGGPFNITPTSQGQAECRLQYPADATRRTLTPTTAAMPASFEQYVYPRLWDTDSGEIPVSQPSDYSHWDLLGQNQHPAAPLAGDDWYGLQGSFTVAQAGPWTPRVVYHYVPVLWLASAQPYAEAPAAPSPPTTGRRTVGYKATLLFPQNLRFAKATAKVRRGRKATLRGSLALPVDASPSAAVAWAPGGTVVVVQKKVGSRWVTAKRVRTGSNGAWKAVVRVWRTTRWRARWAGSAVIGPEVSLVKKTTVRKR